MDRENSSKLVNQATLMAELAEQWQQAIDAGFAISIFLIDVDDFSHLNNKKTHFEAIVSAVDQLLQRQTDFITPFDRDRILFVTSHLDFKRSKLLAERLHQAIAALKIPRDNSPASPYVTVSIGHTTYAPQPDDDYGVLDMIATVIRHTKTAKTDGGNTSHTRLHSHILK